VSPLRETIIQDMNDLVKSGVINPNSFKIPTFRTDIKSTVSTNIHPPGNVEQLDSLKCSRDNIWENEHYKHVYKAMKKAREEIAEAIMSRKMILFETIPMSFVHKCKKYHAPKDKNRDDGRLKLDVSNKWSIMAN
jgi:hypothetical protein